MVHAILQIIALVWLVIMDQIVVNMDVKVLYIMIQMYVLDMDLALLQIFARVY